MGRLLRPIYPGPATWLSRSDLDVLAPKALIPALKGAGAVICLAGITNTSDRPMELNSTIAASVLDAAQIVGAGRVILFSSAAVYGHGQSGSLLREDGPTAPTTAYGHAKLAMETMAKRHAHPNTTVRLGNVAGADAILGNWKPGFTLDTFSDGTTPRRSYIGPNSLARALFDLTTVAKAPELVNIAAPGCVQMGELLDSASLPWQSRPATDQTIAHVELDTTVLEEITAFDPRDSTPSGIVGDWRIALDAQ